MRRVIGLISLFLISLLLLPTTAQSSAVVDVPRVGLDKEVIYFVMPDRYRNGDPANDKQPGFDPTSTAFFHGGDLKGLTGNCQDDDGLARLKRLGFTAIWVTPLVVQQPPTEGGAGYHGYWGTDFLKVDPHLGTNEDLKALSNCAKQLGLKLILDVVTNHTGDIVWYKDRIAYIPEIYKNIKNPAWLNDISNYHNAGDMNSCWSEGSCMRDGDFYGLDDLATEKEVVYKGWADVYGSWISNYGFVGFRVDTARHVDNSFFTNWSPLIDAKARASGIDKFTIFGEVWERNPTDLMQYVRVNKIQTALDFPFQRVAVEYAANSSDAGVLQNLFEYDDYYTSETSSAQNLVTFLGNHDMGRVAFLIDSQKMNPASQLLSRVKLAHALLYLSRGIPVVYYGDEVGMTGSGNGNDQRARQDMFPTQVEMWKSEKRVGGRPVGNGDSFADKSNPIATYLTDLSKIRSANPALANGQMQIRYAQGAVFAFSKRASNSDQEFLVVLNNSAKSQTVTIPTATSSSWKAIFGKGSWKQNKSDLRVTIPALESVVLKASKAITDHKVTLGKLSGSEDFLSGFYAIQAKVTSRDLVTTEFLLRDGDSWRRLGVDISAPFTYYLNPEEISGKIEVTARVTDSKGKAYEFKPISLTIATP